MKIFLKPFCLLVLTRVIGQLLEIFWFWEFPGGPVIRIQRFHCHGPGSIPGEGTKITQPTWCSQKKKKERKKKKKDFVFHIAFFSFLVLCSQALCAPLHRRSVYVRPESRRLLQTLPFLDCVFIKPELPDPVVQEEGKGESRKATKGP